MGTHGNPGLRIFLGLETIRECLRCPAIVPYGADLTIWSPDKNSARATIDARRSALLIAAMALLFNSAGTSFCSGCGRALHVPLRSPAGV